MPPDPRCPERDRLKDLLDDRLAPDEQAAIAAHLEGCETCREAFDGLAAASGMWNDVRGLAEGVGRRDDTRETHEAPPVDDGIPGFLDPPDPDDPDQIGRFGPYEVLGVIGRGGWGIVLKGFDPALHRPVAIKVLAPQYATSATARRRFVREARAAASISHDHVVTIHAVDECKGLPYLVMQYVAGKSLQERIDHTGPLEVKEVLRIGMQAARGLAAAHAQGLIHRDVKPANILLENGIERVKLTDFGLARAVDDASLTQSGLVAGTPQYMAPEQARGEAVDHRADLFSLGGVLYAMATGHSPFRGWSTMAVLRRVCDEAPRPVREANPDIPEEVAAVIHRLLAKDPAERFASAGEVADVLSSQLARRQHAAPTVDAPEVGPQKAPHEPARSTAPKPRRPRVGEYLVIAAGMLMVLVVTNPFGVASQVKEFVQTVLRIKTAHGTLVLNLDDPNIKVRVDGEDVVLDGAGPNTITLSPGSHDLRASTGDGREAGMLVTIERGDKKVASIRHEPSGQPALVVGDRSATLLPKPIPPGEETQVIERTTIAADRVGTAPPSMRHGPVGIATPATPGHPDLAPLPATEGSGPSVATRPAKLPRPELRTSIATNGTVQALAFSRDGCLVATGESPQILLTPDLSFRSRIADPLWEGPKWYDVSRRVGRIEALAIAPEGNAFALGGCGNPATLTIWDLDPNRPPDESRARTFVEQEAGFTALAYSPDGKHLAVGDAAGTVKIWDVATGRILSDLTNEKEHATPITHLIFFKDGRGTNGMAVLLEADRVRGDRGFGLRLYDVEGVRAGISRTLDVTGGSRGPDFEFTAECLAVSPDAKSLFVGTKGGGIRYYDLTLGGRLRRIFGDVTPTALALTPDGKALIVGNPAGEVTIYDPPTGREGTRFKAHRGRIRSIAVAPDGGMFATGSDDKVIRFWLLVPTPIAAAPAALVPAVPAAPPATTSHAGNADDHGRAAMIALARKNGGRMPAAGEDEPRRDEATVELARSLVDQAERRLAEAEAAREEARGDVERANKEIVVAEKTLSARESHLKRIQQLVAQNAVEARTLEETRLHNDEAAMGVRVARARAALAESKVASAEARVAEARAELAVAELNLRAIEQPEPGLRDQQHKARIAQAERELEVARAERQSASRAVEVARAALEREVADRKYLEHVVARVNELVEKRAIEQRLADEEKDRLEITIATEQARTADLKAAESRLKLAERRVTDAEARLKRLKGGDAQREGPARAEGSSRRR
ncbi:MAG TPA: protein kinase [Isosphaeraceae bacterium]|jgi:serine/threonine protein kinase/WD40 repeat protein|nr:protein kinase [Isosphaeraceae bacterium]